MQFFYFLGFERYIIYDVIARRVFATCGIDEKGVEKKNIHTKSAFSMRYNNCRTCI